MPRQDFTGPIVLTALWFGGGPLLVRLPSHVAANVGACGVKSRNPKVGAERQALFP